MTMGMMMTAWAAEKDDVEKRFVTKADAVVKVVKNKSLNSDQRNDKIIDVVDPLFDFRLMAKLSLGKHAWRALDETKKQEFTKLYVIRMKNSFSQKIDNYTDEKIVVRSVKQTKGNRITLVTDLVGTDDNTEVIYKYHKTSKPIKDKDQWLIYDAIISGVSIIKTDRSQFTEVLRAGTIDSLMDKMRQKQK